MFSDFYYFNSRKKYVQIKWSIVLFLFTSSLLAQDIEKDSLNNEKFSLRVGYYAPYINQFGARVGFSYPLKKWAKENKKAQTRIHKLEIIPKLGYFANIDIQRNYFLDVELQYKWYRPKRKIHPKIGVALGYMLARQNIGATVNLGNGSFTFDRRSLHFLVPTIHLGFEKNRANRIGYYFSAFYGRKFTGQEVNSDIFGLEAGIVLNFSKNK